MKKKSKSKQKYLHGFSDTEQERLLHQARFLEPYVYAGVDLEEKRNLLEVGCGVGAQSKILCRRFPDLTITGVDLSDQQLKLAKKFLRSEISDGRITLMKQNAQELKIPGPKFDSAFLCWFLEHVPNPLQALKKVKAHLESGAKIYCSEVFNQSLYVEPYSPNFLKYWFQFNDLQWTLNGHPFIGARLGNLLKEAGFKDIQIEIRPFHFDSRDPKRRASFTEYFLNILLSAQESLIADGRVTLEEVEKLKTEMKRVQSDPNAVFYYNWIRATAIA